MTAALASRRHPARKNFHPVPRRAFACPINGLRLSRLVRLSGITTPTTVPEHQLLFFRKKFEFEDSHETAPKNPPRG
jgi:hypothetical protein